MIGIRRRLLGVRGAGCAACGLLTLALFGGCAADHRLSMGEFIAMQRGAAETAPVAEAVSAADIDAHIGPYRVGAGDDLRIELNGADGASLFPAAVNARIDRNGQIDLPVVGAIKVSDLPLEDVEDTILKAYVPGVFREATCHVELASTQPTNVLVVGAVSAPGLIPLRRTERNLLFAIVGAGGVSDAASGMATLRRVRRPAEEVTLNLRDPVQLQAALTLNPLDNGDIISVQAAAPNTVFVGGLVATPHPQTYAAGTNVTILQALAAAGGLRTDVTPSEGTLIRRMPNGQEVQVKLDLEAIAKGREPNLELAAGDILWVPQTFGTIVQDFINKNIFLRAGVSVNYNVSGIEFLNRRKLQSAGAGGGSLQDAFDPFGFLTRNTLLQTVNSQTAVAP